MDLIVLASICGGMTALVGVAYAVSRRSSAVHATPIADAAEGAVITIAGTVEDGETLPAALSGRACVLYHLEIRGETEPAGLFFRRRRLPRSVSKIAGVVFAIEDAGGRAIVDPSHATVRLTPSVHEMPVHGVSPAQAALMSEHDLTAAHFREGILAIGARVAITGVAVREPDPDGAARVTGYRGDAPTRLRLAGTEKQPLVIRAI